MIPTNDAATNTALFLICSMSPTAKNGIELESYRQTADQDMADNEHILESAFINLTKDLQTLGLVLEVDYSSVFETKDSLFSFLTLVSYLLPNPLYAILKRETKIKECLEHILTGSLGDDETLIQTYLSELGGLDGQDPLVPELATTIDHVYSAIGQTDQFTDYIRNIIQLVQDERLVVEADDESHNAYRAKLRSLISRFARAVNAFEHHPDYEKLASIQNHLILNFVAPDNFIEYNYLFVIGRTNIPDDLVASFDKKWYHYAVSNVWCAPYHDVRKTIPTEAEKLAMYCFVYAIHETQSEARQEMGTLVTRYPHLNAKQVIDALYQE